MHTEKFPRLAICLFIAISMFLTPLLPQRAVGDDTQEKATQKMTDLREQWAELGRELKRYNPTLHSDVQVRYDRIEQFYQAQQYPAVIRAGDKLLEDFKTYRKELEQQKLEVQAQNALKNLDKFYQDIGEWIDYRICLIAPIKTTKYESSAKSSARKTRLSTGSPGCYRNRKVPRRANALSMMRGSSLLTSLNTETGDEKWQEVTQETSDGK